MKETEAKPEVKKETEAKSKESVITCRCTVKCHYEGHLYRVGETIVTGGYVPDHFEKIQ